jgi:hypothetical protein
MDRLEPLRTLAAGDLGAFFGLAAQTSFADVAAVFGDTEPGPDGVAFKDGQPVTFRMFSAGGLAPWGFTAWATDGIVDVLHVPTPTLPAGALEALGPPETSSPSGLQPAHTQLAWPSRGIAAHRFNGAPADVLAVYAFVAMSEAAFLEHWVSRVSVGRHPR